MKKKNIDSQVAFLNSTAKMMKFAEEFKPSLKGNNSIDSSVKILDYNSIANIKKILLNAVGWIFDSAQVMFFNAKKIFYIASMLLMIYDAYRYVIIWEY